MRAEGRDPQEHMCNVNTALTLSRTRNFVITCSLFVNKLHSDKCDQSRASFMSELCRQWGEACVHMCARVGGSGATCTPPAFQVRSGLKERAPGSQTELVSGVVFSVGFYL